MPSPNFSLKPVLTLVPNLTYSSLESLSFLDLPVEVVCQTIAPSSVGLMAGVGVRGAEELVDTVAGVDVPDGRGV